MNTIGHEEARRLIEKFFDGATSNAEEAQLHEYFAHGDIAEDMLPYAGMMGWFADLDASGRREPRAKTSVISVKRIWRRSALIGLAAAAAIGLVVTTGIGRLGIGSATEYDQELLEMYEGSYMVRDGKKVTDLKKVLPTILEIERCAAKMRNEARSEFTSVRSEMYDEMYEACDSIINCMAVENLELE